MRIHEFMSAYAWTIGTSEDNSPTEEYDLFGEDERICKICGEPLPEEEEEECHFECEVMLSSNDPDGTGQDEEEEMNE